MIRMQTFRFSKSQFLNFTCDTTVIIEKYWWGTCKAHKSSREKFQLIPFGSFALIKVGWPMTATICNYLLLFGVILLLGMILFFSVCFKWRTRMIWGQQHSTSICLMSSEVLKACFPVDEEALTGYRANINKSFVRLVELKLLDVTCTNFNLAEKILEQNSSMIQKFEELRKPLRVQTSAPHLCRHTFLKWKPPKSQVGTLPMIFF